MTALLTGVVMMLIICHSPKAAMEEEPGAGQEGLGKSCKLSKILKYFATK